MRNQMAMAPQILAQGQQRLQGVPAQFEPRFMERFVPEFRLRNTKKDLSGKGQLCCCFFFFNFQCTCEKNMAN